MNFSPGTKNSLQTYCSHGNDRKAAYNDIPDTHLGMSGAPHFKLRQYSLLAESFKNLKPGKHVYVANMT